MAHQAGGCFFGQFKGRPELPCMPQGQVRTNQPSNPTVTFWNRLSRIDGMMNPSRRGTKNSLLKRWTALPTTAYVRATLRKWTLWYEHSVTIMVVLSET